MSIEDLLAHGAVKRGSIYTLKSLGQGFMDRLSRDKSGECKHGYAAELGYRTKSYISRLSSSLSRMKIRHVVEVTGMKARPDGSYENIYEIVKDKWPDFDIYAK